MDEEEPASLMLLQSPADQDLALELGVEAAVEERCQVWKADSVNFRLMIESVEEIQVTSAAGVRWTGGSEVVDLVERAFAGVELLSVQAVVLEVGVAPLEQRGAFQ